MDYTCSTSPAWTLLAPSSNPVLLRIILIIHLVPNHGKHCRNGFSTRRCGHGKHILAADGWRDQRCAKTIILSTPVPTAGPHSCPTLPRMFLLPIIFPTATAGQDLTITKLLKQTQQHLAHRLYQVPAALPQIHLDKEEKTGCVMLGMSHTPLAQPALAFEQGGKQVPEQRAAAACSHPARSWSIQPASVLHFQQLGGNRDLPILAQKRGTWSVYPEFLGMSAEIPKLQKIYCRSSDVTFTQEHTSWQWEMTLKQEKFVRACFPNSGSHRFVCYVTAVLIADISSLMYLYTHYHSNQIPQNI